MDRLDYVTTQVQPLDGRAAARRDSVVGQHDRLDVGGRLLYLGRDSREGVVRQVEDVELRYPVEDAGVDLANLVAADDDFANLPQQDEAVQTLDAVRGKVNLLHWRRAGYCQLRQIDDHVIGQVKVVDD